ncbi:RNA polymerase sigma factor [Wenyingzhuangia sp. 1_MG-2023]|nr:RNA polymerase sigma factor [Wenyingzhuangia sp. 1_MG-2023]
MGNLKELNTERYHANDKKESHVVLNKHKVSDLVLWQEFQLGSETAFAKIYEDHVGRLYSYGLKIVYDKSIVKDAVQDLFIELWDTKEKLSEVKSIKSYLFTSLRRKLIKQQVKYHKIFNKNENVETINYESESVEFSLIEKQRLDFEKQSLKIGLEKLEPKQREIVFLKYYARLSYEEIMEIMDIDKKQAYNLLSRTLKTLKEFLIFLILFLNI